MPARQAMRSTLDLEHRQRSASSFGEKYTNGSLDFAFDLERDIITPVPPDTPGMVALG